MLWELHRYLLLGKDVIRRRKLSSCLLSDNMIIAIILMVDVTDTTVVSLISDTVDTTVVYRPQVDYRHDGRVRYFSQYGHDGHVLSPGSL